MVNKIIGFCVKNLKRNIEKKRKKLANSQHAYIYCACSIRPSSPSFTLILTYMLYEDFTYLRSTIYHTFYSQRVYITLISLA